MNKNLFILPAAVLALGLASCAKTITRDEALKFVTENYKNSTSKTAKSGKVTWDFSNTKGDNGKIVARVVIYYLTGKDSSDLKGSYEKSDLGLQVPPLNKDSFTFESDATFKLKGKELSVEYEKEIENASTPKAYASLTFNSDGYPYLEKEKIDNYKIDDNNIVNGNVETRFTF